MCKLEAKESTQKYKDKYERKLESINKLLNLIEKDVTYSRFDDKKYEHEKVYPIFLKSFEKVTEDISESISELLKSLQNNFPAKKATLEPSTSRVSNSRTPISVSSKFKELISRESIASNMSSMHDETMMTEMNDYRDPDKVEIYQTLDDLIKIIEAKEIILQTQKKKQTYSYITPIRQQRKGVGDLLTPSAISPSPFAHHISEDSFEEPVLRSIEQILFPNLDLKLSNIDSSIISEIYSVSKSQLNSSLSSLLPQLPPSQSNVVQRLSTLKKQFGANRTSLMNLLYSSYSLNAACFKLISYIEAHYRANLERIQCQVYSMAHCLALSSMKTEEVKVAQTPNYLKLFDKAARVIQQQWRKKLTLIKIEKIRVSKEAKVKAVVHQKAEISGKLDKTHGNTGRFLLKQSNKHVQNLFDELLHMFVFKQQGFTFGDDENL